MNNSWEIALTKTPKLGDLVKPIMITIKPSGMTFIANNDNLNIRVIADTFEEVIIEFERELHDNWEKYEKIIFDAIDNGINERHKGAWVRLASI